MKFKMLTHGFPECSSIAIFKDGNQVAVGCFRWFAWFVNFSAIIQTVLKDRLYHALEPHDDRVVCNFIKGRMEFDVQLYQFCFGSCMRFLFEDIFEFMEVPFCYPVEYKFAQPHFEHESYLEQAFQCLFA